MFNIKKQINRLYASSILGQVSFSGAWVAILSARGFSLAQIGFAETIFHIVSVLFEIPSGMIADVFGRKRTLVISSAMRILGDLAMILSNDFFLVCVSIALHALCYNFASGSGDALAYDSLKSVGKEAGFERYASNQLVIYRACEGLSTLTAGFALVIGYRLAYATGIAFTLAQIFALAGLKEIRIEKSEDDFCGTEENCCGGIFCSAIRKIKSCFVESVLFLKTARRALLLMFANSFAGAMDILLLFFLQAKLPMAGIPNWALGLALLFMQAGGVLGARTILTLQKIRWRAIFAAAFAVICIGILMEHSGLYAVMALGGFFAAFADDALQARTNALLQNMFPSEQRATLISVESLTFSCVMIFLSPLAGLFFSRW